MLPIVSGFALGCLTLLLIAVLKQHARLAVGEAFAALLIVTAAFVVHPLLPSSYQFVTQIAQTAVPACFWLVCVLAFSERTSFHPVLVISALCSVVLPMGHTLAELFVALPVGLTFLLKTIPSYLEYVLIFSGLWVVVSHWSEDLVETRRRLRMVISVFMGITVLANVVFVNFGFAGEVFQRLLVVLCLVGTGFFLMTIPGGILFGLPKESKEATELEVRSKLEQPDGVKALKDLMADGFYAEANLTIAQLASKLSLPEYRVRRLINEQLGFRNFNDFLNHYRIEAAMVELQSHPEKPIMNIALDLGYRTLSSFNRAFKERVNLTPTQFRQQTTKV